MGPSLPLPPPAPSAPVGGTTPLQGPAPGTLPYRTPVAAQAMQGLTGFMQNFMAMRQATKEMHKNQFEQGLNAIQLGVPMGPKDLERIMKHGKKAGYDWLPTEPPTPEEQQYATQAKQQYQAQQTLGQMPPQGPNPIQFGPDGQPIGDPATASMLQGLQQTATQPLQAPPPRPQPGFGQRVLGAMGLSNPQVSVNSPMGGFLQNLSQAAQSSGGLPGQVARAGKTALNQQDMQDLEVGFQKQFGFPMKGMNANQEMAIMNSVKQAFNGDWTARDNLARMSNGWQLPMDQFRQVMRLQNPDMPASQVDQKAAQLFQYIHMGGLQYQQFMMNYSKDLAPHFGDNPYKAMQWLMDPQHNPGPAMSAQEYEQYREGQSKLYNAYPKTDIGILDQLASTYMTPGFQQYRTPLLNILNAKNAKGDPINPRSGTQEEKLTGMRLGPEWYRVQDDALKWRQDLEYNKTKSLSELDQQKWNKIWDLAMKDPTADAFNSAVEDLANLRSKDAQLSYTIGGKKYPIDNPQEVLQNYFRGGWFVAGKNYLSNRQAPENFLQSVLGNPGAPPMLEQYAKQISAMPDGRDKLAALGSVLQAVQGVPHEQRQALIDKLKPSLGGDIFMNQAIQAISGIDLPPVQIGGSPWLAK